MTTQLEQIDVVQDLARDAVGEVFKTMLSTEVTSGPPFPLPPDPHGEVVSSVGFIGKVTGAVYLYATAGYARTLTSRMLGITESEIESGDMVNDALGELSNMVVGHVKSQLCDRGFACALTIPSIVRGQSLSVERAAHVTTRVLAFRDNQNHLLAEIFIKKV